MTTYAYVVCRGGPEWNDIEGVYLNKEDAQAYRDKLNACLDPKDVMDSLSHYYIETCPIRGRI